MHVDSKCNNLGDTTGKCKPGGSLGNFKKSGRLPSKPGGWATMLYHIHEYSHRLSHWRISH